MMRKVLFGLLSLFIFSSFMATNVNAEKYLVKWKISNQGKSPLSSSIRVEANSESEAIAKVRKDVSRSHPSQFKNGFDFEEVIATPIK